MAIGVQGEVLGDQLHQQLNHLAWITRKYLYRIVKWLYIPHLWALMSSVRWCLG